jgi:hypothetical protein
MDRIKRIAGDLANGWEVTFDRESGSDLIHYRICDRFGRVLAVSGYDLQSTMADWSDDDLRQRMRGLLVASFVPSLYRRTNSAQLKVKNASPSVRALLPQQPCSWT